MIAIIEKVSQDIMPKNVECGLGITRGLEIEATLFVSLFFFSHSSLTRGSSFFSLKTLKVYNIKIFLNINRAVRRILYVTINYFVLKFISRIFEVYTRQVYLI